MNAIKLTKRQGTILTAILLSVAAAVAGCSHTAKEQAGTTQAKQQEQKNVKRYKLVGKIVSIDASQKTLNVDGQDIPGFMSAMVMPYPVLHASDLTGLEPGDEITADVVVNQADSSAHLEHIVVTKKAGGKPTSELHIPQPGDQVPDFVVVNQNDKRVHLSSFRGRVLLVTFIYTRCPFANYCPLVSHDFAEIYAETKKDEKLARSVRLLTVSFDPEHDSPPVLRKYGESFREVTGTTPFDRWEFAAAPTNEVRDMANFFGLTYSDTDGKIIHSMSTTVIAPDGKVYKWYDGSDWQASQLVTDAADALRQESSSHASGKDLPANPAGI